MVLNMSITGLDARRYATTTLTNRRRNDVNLARPTPFSVAVKVHLHIGDAYFVHPILQ